MINNHERINHSKAPHFIDSKVLTALGGKEVAKTVDGQKVPLIEGAYLWGVLDKEKGRGILRHSCLTSRVAYHLARDLKNKRVEGYQNISLRDVVHGALLHDSDKLFAESREKLSPEVKKKLGIPSDFRESSEGVGGADETASQRLKKLEFPPKNKGRSLLENCFSR